MYSTFFIKLGLAVGLGFLIGLEREFQKKSMGIKTSSLITLGAMLFVLMSSTMTDGDNTRIVAQVVSGIGFLGAGIIFKDGTSVKGLTTAATAWTAAAVGCLVGTGMYVEAASGTAVILLINIVITRIELWEKKRRLAEQRQKDNDKINTQA